MHRRWRAAAGRGLWAVLALSLSGTAVAAGASQAGLTYPQQAPSAAEIARQVYHVNHFHSVANISYGSKETGMVLINKARDARARMFQLERHLNNDYDDGVTRARDLVIFRSGKLRGTGILVTDYLEADKPLSFAVWLPELRKVRRHSQPHQGDTWGGSVFTYGDIYLRKPTDETHELLASEPFSGCLGTMGAADILDQQVALSLPTAQCALHGRLMYRVKSSPRTAGWWYDYRVVWVDRESFADYRSEYYKNGALIKVLDKDWRSMELADPRAQYWVYWYARDMRSQNQGIAYVPENLVTWNQQVDAARWTLGNLRRIKR